MLVCVQFAATTGEAGKSDRFSPQQNFSASPGGIQSQLSELIPPAISVSTLRGSSPSEVPKRHTNQLPPTTSACSFNVKEQQFHSESSAELSATHRICEAEPGDLRKRTYFDCLHPLVTKDMGCSHCQIKMFVFWFSCCFSTTIRWMPASVSGCTKPPSLFYPLPDT